jgi:hypothetical protein
MGDECIRHAQRYRANNEMRNCKNDRERRLIVGEDELEGLVTAEAAVMAMTGVDRSLLI